MSMYRNPKGYGIITREGQETQVFFILTGAFDVSVNGRKIARRFINGHVGEMAAVQSILKRSTSITATEDSVVIAVSAIEFSELGKTYQEM